MMEKGQGAILTFKRRQGAFFTFKKGAGRSALRKTQNMNTKHTFLSNTILSNNGKVIVILTKCMIKINSESKGIAKTK